MSESGLLSAIGSGTSSVDEMSVTVRLDGLKRDDVKSSSLTHMQQAVKSRHLIP